jgi:hypothetical protein
MSVNNKQPSIYCFKINSLEDVNLVINSNKKAKQKVSNILDYKHRFSNIETSENNIYISVLYKEIYYKSLGFSTCKKAVNGIDNYQELLKNSFSACNNIITPLLIRSFKCHQEALPYFAKNRQHKSALASMSETGKIAETIADEYKKLGKEFNLLGNREAKTMVDLNQDQYLIYAKQKTLQAEKNLAAILDKGISSLDNALKSSGKLVTAIRNMGLFLQQAGQYSESLTRPDLADSNRIALMRKMKSEEIQNNFDAFLKEQENSINVITLNPPNEKKSLDEVFKSMKTGQDTTLSYTPKEESIIELFQSTTFSKVEKAFEASYLNWLALAKIHQIMVAALHESIIEVERDKNSILETEKDPLVIALHTTAL